MHSRFLTVVRERRVICTHGQKAGGALHKKSGNRRAPFDTAPENKGPTQGER